MPRLLRNWRVRVFVCAVSVTSFCVVRLWTTNMYFHVMCTVV